MESESGTVLQIAQHRVREAEKHVAYFRTFVAELRRDGMYAAQAEDLLRQLEIGLEEHREHLAQVHAGIPERIGPGAEILKTAESRLQP